MDNLKEEDDAIDLTNIVYSDGMSPRVFGLVTIYKNRMKAEMEFHPKNGLKQDILIEHRTLGKVPLWQANLHDACMMIRDDFTARMKIFIENGSNHD